MMKILTLLWLEANAIEEIQNIEIMTAFLNKCQKTEAAELLCGDQRWKFIKTHSGCGSLASRCLGSSLSSAIGSKFEIGKLF